MKRCNRFLAFVLLVFLLLPTIAVIPAYANTQSGGNTSEARYTQKIVTVVYDNSGSMDSYVDKDRIPSARYSLSLLISMLDTRDIMKVFPMNRKANGIPVDLSGSDRNAVIQSVLKDSSISSYSGGTYTTSTVNALKFLSEQHGLKDKDHLIDSEGDKEYWLIILTDGLFEDNPDPGFQASTVANLISKYPTLNTVYVSFGSDAIDITNRPELDSLPITPYCKVPAAQLPTVMQKISNQISSRYPLAKNDQYTASGNQITIDLDEIDFSVSSLTVIAQGCGATIGNNDVSYTPPDDAATVKATLTDICTIGGSGFGVNTGCSFKILPETYLSGGTLTLTFSDTINSDFLSIYAEPALDISYYFEAEINQQWERVDSQYINSQLRPGDSIRVGYEVYDQVKNSLIDLGTVFGEVDAQVTYAQASHSMGVPISLIKGTHELSIEVSVMDGAFVLRDSTIITVEEDPSYFRVEAQGDTVVSGTSPTTNTIFTVFLDNAPATRDQLSDFTCTAVATASDGTVIFEKEVTPSADGKISVPLTMETNQFDVYTIALKVVSPQRLSRSASHTVTYAPDSLTLTLQGSDHLSITQFDLKTNTESFTFELTTNGLPFPFVNGLTEYQLLVGDTDVTASATVSGNALTYIPTEANLNGLAKEPGDKEVRLVLKSSAHPNLETAVTATLTVIKTVYTVVPVASTLTTIDRFDLKNCSAVLYYSIERDGIPFTEEDIHRAVENGDFDIETATLFSSPLLPAGIETEVLTVHDTAVLAVKAVRDMNTYFDWHLSAFIKGNDSPVTVSYSDSSCTQSFSILPSQLFTHILRIVLFFLVIFWILHLVPFLISLFIAKPLPRGIVIYFSGVQVDFFEINVNFVKAALHFVLWILLRFLVPGTEFLDQPLWFQNPGLSDFELKFNRKDGLHFMPADPDCYFKVKARSSHHNNLNRYCNYIVENSDEKTLAEYLGCDPRDFSLITYFDKENTISLRTDAVYELFSGRYYGIFYQARDNSVRLSNVIVFASF